MNKYDAILFWGELWSPPDHLLWSYLNSWHWALQSTTTTSTNCFYLPCRVTPLHPSHGFLTCVTELQASGLLLRYPTLSSAQGQSRPFLGNWESPPSFWIKGSIRRGCSQGWPGATSEPLACFFFSMPKYSLYDIFPHAPQPRFTR